MMDENKFMEKFTDGAIKGATQVASLFVAAVLCAAATATDPFFRRNLGERYFTPFRCFVSAMGWFALIYASACFSWYLHGQPSVFVILFGVAIFIAYLVVSRLNFNAMRRRKATGELWHSRSKGESMFGSESVKRDMIIAVAVSIALGCVSLVYAVFFILSRVMGLIADEMAQAALYNRYLDIIDGKIEAQFMETALRDGFPPSKTGGVYRPLPDIFRGERRANVARIIAGEAFAAGTAEAMPEEPQTPRSFPRGGGGSPSTVASYPHQETDLKSAFQDATGTAAETLASVLRSRRLIRFAVIALFLVAVAAVATPVVRFIHARWIRPADVAESAPAQPSRTNPSTLTRAASTPLPLTQAPGINSATEKSNFDARVQAAVEALRREDAEKQAALEAKKREEQAKEEAALEARKRQEAERLAALEAQRRQERETMIQQINSTIASQVAILSQFKTDCRTRLDNNTNKIAKVATASRKSLTKSNDEFRQLIANNVQGDETSLDNFQKDMQAVSSNPQVEPRRIGVQLTNLVEIMEGNHKRIFLSLAELDTAISNAPPQRGLLDFIKITAH